ncbi:MAG TPA: hypothetical protein VHC19_24690 [Pirellulales bacterium]|nr:hypothetical protein [Pirellulales bacterium]
MRRRQNDAVQSQRGWLASAGGAGLPLALAAALALFSWADRLAAQTDAETRSAAEPSQDGGEPAAKAAADDELALSEEQIRAKYQDFERVLLRMSELTAASDPKRAALLRKAVGESKDKLIALQFERLVDALKKDRLANAVTQQTTLEEDLAGLLELLLTEQRGQQLKSERERVKAQIRELKELINKQQQLQGQTAGQGDTKRLGEGQDKLAKQTGKLAGEMKQAANDAKPGQPGENQEQEAEGDGPGKQEEQGEGKKSKQGSPAGEKEGDEKSPEEGKKPSPADADDKDADKKDGDDKEAGKEGKAQNGKNEKGGAEKSGKSSQDDQPRGGDSPSPGGKEKQEQDGQPGENQEQKSPPGQGQSQGEGQQQPQSQQNQPEPSAQESAQQRVQAARQRMDQAKKKLENAERKGAMEEQEQAVRELELAKAKLEEILRQLREEELRRTLALLEARFRKMLEMQIEVHDGTKLLADQAAGERDRNDEIEAGRLSRKEGLIVVEVDAALVLLKEEGSSVAFPEAVGQMREDMEQVVQRLSQAKADEITVAIEEEIIAALEEMIAALQKAQKDQEEKQQQQQQQQQGESQEPPLVDALAELKMIRSLQMRVNNRTARYAKMVEGEEGQADKAELIEALQKLSERETRIFKTTRDIVLEKNK